MNQSKINFKPGTAAIPVLTKTTTASADTLEDNENDMNSERSKRQRTDHTEEFEEGELRDDLLQIPNELDSAGSEQSLFNSDSISTIVETGPKESQPARRTNINSHFLTAEELDVKVIKLERLRDKSDRYSSHIEFL